MKRFLCVGMMAGMTALAGAADFSRTGSDSITMRGPVVEGDVDKLWETARTQNTEAAAARRLDLLLDAQRRQVAHHAGEQWQPLLDYLSGKLKQLPEG